MGQVGSKLIFGVGINDVSGYSSTKCYTVWHSMMRRCYSAYYQERKPSYRNTEVDCRWHRLSGFIPWFYENYKIGFELDKDIIDPSAEIYSPETCCFVPKEVNSLLIARRGKGGKLGVYYKRANSRWCAQVQCPRSGKNLYLGLFETETEANEAYLFAKQGILDYYAERYAEDLPAHVVSALKNYFKEK